MSDSSAQPELAPSDPPADHYGPLFCEYCGGTRGGVELEHGTTPTCGKCAICFACGSHAHPRRLFQPPVFVPEMQRYLHAGNTENPCRACADCGGHFIKWSSPYDCVVPPGTMHTPRLLCPLCTSTCACPKNCGTSYRQYCGRAGQTTPIERRLFVTELPDGLWIIPTHRPCAECGEMCLHIGSEAEAAPQPVGKCPICKKCVHFAREHWKGRYSEDKTVVRIGGKNSEGHWTHVACLKCTECGTSDIDFDQYSHNFGWRVHANKYVHVGCATCIICHGRGVLAVQLPGKGKRPRTKKYDLVWRRTESGDGWTHKVCIEHNGMLPLPEPKRQKVDE